MKVLIILVVLVVVALILKSCLKDADHSKSDYSRPPLNKKPVKLINNDKLILISNVNIDELKKALTGFCNAYNKNDYAALPRITTISPTSFAVTFPYDTDFATFCFAVNYLKYPIDIKWQSKVIGWVTTKEGDEWITEKTRNKKVMLFLAENDNEYDNVFMTTKDNIGYKLGFAMGEEKQLLQIPKEPYVEPTIKIESLSTLPYIDIE